MTESRRIKRTLAYAGSFISVNQDEVTLPNGHTTTLELIEHPGAAAIVPLDSDGHVVLVRQYRYAAGGYILEVPAGKLGPEEDPTLCALRELEEETGLRAAKLTPLGFVWTTPGFTDEKIWLYLAEELSETTQALEDSEVLTIERVPVKTAVDMAINGEISDGKSVCALFRAYTILNRRN